MQRTHSLLKRSTALASTAAVLAVLVLGATAATAATTIGVDFSTDGTLTVNGGVTMNDASADVILIGQAGATPDGVTIAGNVTLTDNGQWSVSNSGVASFASVNGLSLTSNADGFAIAGGTTSRTFTVVGGAVTLTATGATNITLPTTGTMVGSVATANGVSASNTDGVLTFTLGAITPSSVSTSGDLTVGGALTFTSAGVQKNVTFSTGLAGTNGDTLDIVAGPAGSSTGVGKTGGTAQFEGGNGGISAAGSVGGVGGVALIKGGRGGSAGDATAAGGAGGQAQLTGGTGANGLATDGAAGAGGSVILTGGNAGVPNGAGAGAAGGDIVFLGGPASGAAAVGVVRVGSPSIQSTRTTTLLAVAGGFEVDGATRLDGALTITSGGLAVTGHIVSTPGSAPIAAGTCTSPSVASGATDAKGNISATGCTTAQTLIVQFASAYASAPICVVSPTNAAGALLTGATNSAYASASTTALTITSQTAVTGGAVSFNYICIE